MQHSMSDAPSLARLANPRLGYGGLARAPFGRVPSGAVIGAGVARGVVRRTHHTDVIPRRPISRRPRR